MIEDRRRREEWTKIFPSFGLNNWQDYVANSGIDREAYQFFLGPF